MPDIATLTERLRSSATSYAAIIDGILNIQNVSETENLAAYNALYLSGFRILSNCRDPDCRCKVEALEKLMPAARIVRVAVEARDG